MFQCYSLETSHPRLLPQSPKVCSIHLCLFFCFAYRVIVTIFLNYCKVISLQLIKKKKQDNKGNLKPKKKKNQHSKNKDHGIWSLDGLVLKLKLKYFGHLMQRTDSLEKTLMLGKTESKRRINHPSGATEDEMVEWHHQLNEFEQTPEKVKDMEA